MPVKRARCNLMALWIGLVVSAVTLPSALAQSTLSPEAKTALQEGIAAAKFQNWDSAQKYFDEALAAAPGAPEVLFNQGLLYDRKGGAELVASAWYRAYLAAAPKAQNRSQVEARLIELHAGAEARAAKYMATAKEAARQLAPAVSVYFLPGQSNCEGGFRELLGREISVGHFESVDEIVAWFQGNECHNDFLHSIVSAMFFLEQPQEAPRYIEKISGPWKVGALRLYATVKWMEGDKTSALKLVEEAETVATQLLKDYEKSAVPEHKSNILRLRSEMAIAWCVVENVSKARRSFERIDPNLVTDIVTIQVDSYFDENSPFGRAFAAVAAALLLTGKEKETRAMLRTMVSKIRDDWAREQVQSRFGKVLERLTNTPHEDLIGIWRGYPKFFEVYILDGHGWLHNARTAEYSFYSMPEQDYWSEVVKGDSFGLSQYVLYSDGGKFLTTISGLDAETTVKNLSEGSANLLLGSRKIKEYAEAWREKGAPAQ
jgi:tetratricopeptide (TPR) repeat protein